MLSVVIRSVRDNDFTLLFCTGVVNRQNRDRNVSVRKADTSNIGTVLTPLVSEKSGFNLPQPSLQQSIAVTSQSKDALLWPTRACDLASVNAIRRSLVVEKLSDLVITFPVIAWRRSSSLLSWQRLLAAATLGWVVWYCYNSLTGPFRKSFSSLSSVSTTLFTLDSSDEVVHFMKSFKKDSDNREPEGSGLDKKAR